MLALERREYLLKLGKYRKKTGENQLVVMCIIVTLEGQGEKTMLSRLKTVLHFKTVLLQLPCVVPVNTAVLPCLQFNASFLSVMVAREVFNVFQPSWHHRRP